MPKLITILGCLLVSSIATAQDANELRISVKFDFELSVALTPRSVELNHRRSEPTANTDFITRLLQLADSQKSTSLRPTVDELLAHIRRVTKRSDIASPIDLDVELETADWGYPHVRSAFVNGISVHIASVENSVILASGRSSVSHARSSIIIARGDLKIDNCHGCLIVAEESLRMSHVDITPRENKPNRPSILLCGGELKVSHAHECIICAPKTNELDGLRGVTLINTGYSISNDIGTTAQRSTIIADDSGLLPRSN
ncbi:MAG TPA: hypothetical protein DDW52_06395 [Planctomycetaceae bacterium]|nr:hypothetical protein [Planctomycetaceae bacterium]